VGEGPVEAILEEREQNGPYLGFFDMMRRVNLRAVNKKVLESLAHGGGLDCFEELHRAQYFAPSEKFDTFLEHLVKYGQAYQSRRATASTSLFGDTEDMMVPEPKVPTAEPWPLIDKLNREKEVTGIYISGHPLDDYKAEVDSFTSCTLDELEKYNGRDLNIAGIVTEVKHRISKKGTGWGLFTPSGLCRLH
jgi:DNA polymerase-3 subunit alpha